MVKAGLPSTSPTVGLALAATIAVVLLGFGGSQATIAASPPMKLPAPPPMETVEPASTPQARPVEEPRPAPEQSNAAEPSNGLEQTPAQSEEPPAAGTGRTVIVQERDNEFPLPTRDVFDLLNNASELVRNRRENAPEPFPIRSEPNQPESSWMGVLIEDGPDRGVVVTGVVPDGPASETGIREGDLITAFDGTAVVGVVQFQRLVSETPVGRTVEVTFSRNAEEQNATLTISARPIQFEVVSRPGSTVSPTPSRWFPDGRYFAYGISIGETASRFGVQVQEMRFELRQFFGADPDAGVLIVSMDDDSIGAGAGLQVGDVIVAVDGNRVTSVTDLRNLSEGILATGNALTVTILRDRSEREIEIEPPFDL